MAFSDDSGGFAFSCTDAKISIGASTWATRLSQINKATGEILILTRGLRRREKLRLDRHLQIDF
ncbi:hypothetical protein [Pseudomonas sp. GL-R-19]|uniref:hypothetical protein n=1 Tax=Pseudomonas sp. GL-R-19 TaxID=2832391 RepID=UPI001CBFEC4A|nr:hypothetical protein [Pseudomonas sp. GL-R-19]